MSTIQQALANLRAQGARVSPVFYGHDPRRSKSHGGPTWHYSIRVDLDADTILAALKNDSPGTVVLKPPISDGHHLIVRSKDPSGLASVLDNISNIIKSLKEAS